MDNMSNGERALFVERRVKDILKAYKEHAASIAGMTEGQRDDFVHRRVEYDLATFESISREQASHIALREIIWRGILVLDIIAELALATAFIMSAMTDPKDILVFGVAFTVVTIVFVTSRAINFRLMEKSRNVLDLMYKNASHSANTATLDYLVDEIHDDAGIPSAE